MPDLDLTRRETFRHWSPVTIRFSDQDSLGHINNVALSQYFEVSRTAFVYDVIRLAQMEGEIEFILARVAIDFISELHYPGAVEVGGRLTRVGNKSLTSSYGIFAGDRCIATSEAVNVFYDMETRKSASPPQRVRDILDAEVNDPQLVASNYSAS